MSSNDELLHKLYSYYDNKNTSFHSIYSMAFKNELYSQVINQFYEQDPEVVISNPFLKKTLLEFLSETARYDNDISLLYLYRNTDISVGYLYDVKAGTLTNMNEEFAYYNNLNRKQVRKELYGGNKFMSKGVYYQVYAIAGGPYAFQESNDSGALLVGYNTEPLMDICNKYSFPFNSQFLLLNSSQEVIFNSEEIEYSATIDKSILNGSSGIVKTTSGKRYYIESIEHDSKQYKALYVISWSKLLMAANKNTVLIMAIVMFFASLAILTYISVGRLIRKKIDILTFGLNEIGNNKLSYRIPVKNENDEFDEISIAINNMAYNMEQYIDKLYIYQLKQKSAELSELQTKFNPHFLYNTLDIIRTRLYSSGDKVAADMIVSLSKIFRSFINSKKFVTIKDELLFCNMYIDLFRLQYADKIKIIFDVDSEVLKYGIIRNLLQPVIENYIVHGFNVCTEESYIKICAHMLENNYIKITIIDNGNGITPLRLRELENLLYGQVQDIVEKSYGLKNLSDRVRIFYGSGCGLQIKPNEITGLTLQIIIRALTVREHEKHISL